MFTNKCKNLPTPGNLTFTCLYALKERKKSREPRGEKTRILMQEA